MSVLKLEHVKKDFTLRNGLKTTTIHAVKDASFELASDKTIALVGESGSGKSTFINNISTIDECTEGKVLINGKNVRSMSANEIGHFRYQNLGFIFQDFNLLDTHTMYENISMPLALAHVPKAEIEKRVNNLANELQITSLLHKYPNECSGGQRQRGAICRALINNPHIIVADEPTGNLDSKTSADVLGLLQRTSREFDQTLVMITHNNAIAQLADRIVRIEDGKIVG